MNKQTTRNIEEDLWHWAERKEAAPWPEQAKGKSPEAGAGQPTGAVMRKWLALLGFSRGRRG